MWRCNYLFLCNLVTLTIGQNRRMNNFDQCSHVINYNNYFQCVHFLLGHPIPKKISGN